MQTDNHRTFVYRIRWRQGQWQTAFIKARGTRISHAPKMLQHCVGQEVAEFVTEMLKRHDTFEIRAAKIAVGT